MNLAFLWARFTIIVNPFNTSKYGHRTRKK